MRPLPLIVAILLGTTACQPGPWPPAGPSSSQRSAMATVRFRIRPALMKTAAQAKTFADIHHFTVTLLNGTGTPVVAAGLSNPIQVVTPATSGTLSPVPDGQGYRVAIDAFDAAGVSLSTGGAVPSSNTFDVSGSTITYSSGTEAVCNLSLQDATPGTDATVVTLALDGVPDPDRAAIALLNHASHRAMILPPEIRDRYDWVGVQTGLASGTLPSHEVWGWTARSLEGVATTAQRFPYPASGTGAIAAALAITPTQGTLETVPTLAPVATTLGLRADGLGNAFVSNGTTLTRIDLATGAAVAVPLWGTITAFAVDASGTVYTSAGGDIRTTTGTILIGGINVGAMDLDAENTLYWFDPTTLTIQRSRRFFASYMPAETVCTAPADTRFLAVDAYGDPFFSNGTDVYAARFDETGMALTAAEPAIILSATGITSLAADSVGNLYVTDDSQTVRMVPAGEPASTGYRVAGTGTAPDDGADRLTGLPPTATDNVALPKDLTVSPLGVVLFTSAGSKGVGRWIRRVR